MTSDTDPKLKTAARDKGFTLLAKPLSLVELRRLLERVAPP
jgi:hypothetical protein